MITPRRRPCNTVEAVAAGPALDARSPVRRVAAALASPAPLPVPARAAAKLATGRLPAPSVPGVCISQYKTDISQSKTDISQSDRWPRRFQVAPVQGTPSPLDGYCVPGVKKEPILKGRKQENARSPLPLPALPLPRRRSHSLQFRSH
jgi:hypothetical protein